MNRLGKRTMGALTVVGLMSATGVAGAAFGTSFSGGGESNAALTCPGGMTRLGHVFNEDANIFPDDPETMIEVIYEVVPDGFLLEKLTASTHTGTHIDAPAHFVEGLRTIDDLDASEFVWPAYVIDVRDRVEAEGVVYDAETGAIDAGFQLTKKDIKDYEKVYGKIPKGAMVIIHTGWEDKFGTPAYENDLAPGFAGDAVVWMFNARKIGGIGSDTFGPDSYTDEFFDATYQALLADGVAMPGLNNLDTLDVNGDLMIATAVAIEDGSGIQVDPISCRSSIGRVDRPSAYPGLD